MQIKVPRRHILAFVLLSGLFCGAAGGCAKKVHVPKPAVAPEIVHCFDAVGHRADAKPWLLGGTCCCTPSAEVLADWQRHGYLADKTAQDVIDMYGRKGIYLAVDHQDCNNACEYGPHVVKGGRCMVPPTPGTENYEQVLFNKAYVLRKRAPKAYRKDIPSKDVAYRAAPKPEKE